MKTQLDALLQVMQGLRKDVQAVYPAMKGISQDFERLPLLCQHRGLALFTLDFPALDAMLLQGLEVGRLQLSGPFVRRVSKRVLVPRLFSGLWLRVFDKDANLKLDVDVTAMLFLRQIFRLGKNITVVCSDRRIKATLENYHDIEQRTRRPTLEWASDFIDTNHRSGRLHIGDCLDELLAPGPLFEAPVNTGSTNKESQNQGDWRLLDQIQQVADLVIGSFEHFDSITFSCDSEDGSKGIGFRHGPGAVAEKLKQWEKSHFKSWPAKLQRTFPWELVGKTIGSDQERPLNHELSSRLLCVPKSSKGPRLIAAEPVAHMWCQQGLSSFLCSQLYASPLRRDFVDFRDQSKSGDLVLSASLDRKLATVDLSDASDRLSCWTVERMFRSNRSLLLALHAARTRSLRDDISKSPGFLNLKKFASQGTATTFPVQSLVFLFIALGVCLDGEVSWNEIAKLRNRVRVYGDDIILPTHGYARLLRAMTLLGLKVNVAKSYVKGHFRESCGTDGYLGEDITPVSPETLVADGPESFQAVVDTINNLFLKGLWNASDSLRATLPPRVQRGLRIVAINDTGFAGLTCFSGSDESHLVKRWNTRLHRNEVRVWSLLDRAHKRDRQGYPALLDFVSNVHNHEHARTVSSYADIRKTRDGFPWEPLNTCARIHYDPRRPVQSGDSFTGTYEPCSSSRILRERPTWCLRWSNFVST